MLAGFPACENLHKTPRNKHFFMTIIFLFENLKLLASLSSFQFPLNAKQFIAYLFCSINFAIFELYIESSRTVLTFKSF